MADVHILLGRYHIGLNWCYSVHKRTSWRWQEERVSEISLSQQLKACHAHTLASLDSRLPSISASSLRKLAQCPWYTGRGHWQRCQLMQPYLYDNQQPASQPYDGKWQEWMRSNGGRMYTEVVSENTTHSPYRSIPPFISCTKTCGVVKKNFSWQDKV